MVKKVALFLFITLLPNNIQTKEDCIFCKQLAENKDEENFLLKTFDHFAIFLTLYPLNKGHIIIVPNRHIEQMNGLSKKEKMELIEILNQSVMILKKAVQADGVNVGINAGRINAAHKPDHIHIHVIPRFEATNPHFVPKGFIQIACETEVIHWNLKNLYDDLKKEFDNIEL